MSITFALVRPTIDRWHEASVALICECRTLEDAQDLVEQYLSVWPEISLERWMDSRYTVVDGCKHWKRQQSTEVLKVYTAPARGLFKEAI